MRTKKQQCTTPLRLPPDLKEWAKSQAKQEGLRSLNAWMEKLIRQAQAAVEQQGTA